MDKAFLRLVAEDIQAKFGKDIADIAIVFNNKRPITYLKKHLVDVFGQAIWSPQFFTIQEFIGQSSSQEQASSLSQFFYLFELHNELLQEEGLEPETLEEFYPIAETILADFSQLDYELVDIDQIYMALFDNTEIDLAFQHLSQEQQEFIRQFWQSFSIQNHSGVQIRFLKLWKRLPKLYRAFKAKLIKEKQSNFPSLYRSLAEGNAEKQHFTHSYKKILFVGFNALNRAEAKLFKEWQQEGKALFYFDADAHYLDDNLQEAGLFIRRNIFQTGLINALGEAPAALANRKTAVQLYQCLGKNSATKLLHDVLMEDFKEDSANSQTAAILLADESLLVPLLQSLPNLEVNITTGYPLIQSPIYGLMDLWCEVQLLISHQKKEKIPYPLLETYLSHPMTNVKPELRFKIQKEASEKQLFEIPISEIAIEQSVFPSFFKPLHAMHDVIPGLTRLINVLLEHMAQAGRIRLIESDLLIETRKTLNQLQLGFEKLGPLSISFQIGLVKKAIAPINSAIEGDPLKGIQIMGLLESRCLNFDRVYVLGANEGILPKTSSAVTFLPNNLRKAYGLPILENQDALSAYLFYRHFQFSDTIMLFYNGIVDESSSGEESRFIKQLAFETNFQFIQHHQQQPLLFPEQAKELKIAKTGKIWDKLFQTYITDQKRISASAWTCYLQSPLQFFLKYVAGIKEPPSISQEFEMNNLGSIIHKCMELLFLPYKGLPDFQLTSVLKEKIPLIEGLVLQEIAHQYHLNIQGINELNSLQRIMHKIASAYITMYLEYDMENYQSFRIMELENEEDYNLNFEISINGKSETITIYGIIDRVDEVVDLDGQLKTRIVDYKTGSDKVIFTKPENIFKQDTENKAILQTMFYTYVYEQVTGIKGLEPHLYVARRMREDGTLFSNKSGSMQFTDYFLQEMQAEFVKFLRSSLEELFNPSIPFQHDPDAVVYPSDPYTLFYQYSIQESEDEAANY